MARRKSKAKKLEELLSVLLRLVVLGGFFGTYYLTKSLNASIIISVFLIAIVIAIMFIRKLNHIQRLKKSGIDQMDGRQFEHYLGYLFKSQGYAVKVTRAVGDYGADLVLEKAEEKIAVQAKRYKKSIGIEAVTGNWPFMEREMLFI